jgi:hypothetical protein
MRNRYASLGPTAFPISGDRPQFILAHIDVATSSRKPIGDLHNCQSIRLGLLPTKSLLWHPYLADHFTLSTPFFNPLGYDCTIAISITVGKRAVD